MRTSTLFWSYFWKFTLVKTCTTYLKAVVGPASKLEEAFLIIKREPGNVNFAGALENAWWEVITAAVVANHYICLISAVKFFIGTKFKIKCVRILIRNIFIQQYMQI